jgi:NCS1 family nucleobase:cation symporter-1
MLWNIIYIAASLMSFMLGVTIIPIPVAAVLASDHYLIKRKPIDVPILYQKHGHSE